MTNEREGAGAVPVWEMVETPAALAERMRGLADDVSAGPWHPLEEGVAGPDGGPIFHYATPDGAGALKRARVDTRFVAACREGVPALCDAIDRLSADNEDLAHFLEVAEARADELSAECYRLNGLEVDAVALADAARARAELAEAEAFYAECARADNATGRELIRRRNEARAERNELRSDLIAAVSTATHLREALGDLLEEAESIGSGYALPDGHGLWFAIEAARRALAYVPGDDIERPDTGATERASGGATALRRAAGLRQFARPRRARAAGGPARGRPGLSPGGARGCAAGQGRWLPRQGRTRWS